MGANIDLTRICRGHHRPDFSFFNETAGCFLVEVAHDKKPEEIFAGFPHQVIGETQITQVIHAKYQGRSLFAAPLEMLRAAWKQPMKEVFHS